MTPNLSKASRAKLVGVHPDLVAVVERASASMRGGALDFRVTEGLRTVARQKELMKAGASQTMRSRHLTGHAVDLVALVNGQVRWDWPLYPKLATAMKTAALELGVALEWGGDWKSLKDGPHFQLTWTKYP